MLEEPRTTMALVVVGALLLAVLLRQVRLFNMFRRAGITRWWLVVQVTPVWLLLFAWLVERLPGKRQRCKIP